MKVMDSREESSQPKGFMLKIFTPLVILMTLSGAPVKDLTTWKSCICIQSFYSFLVFSSCIACIVEIPWWGDFSGWSGVTALHILNIVLNSTYIIYYFCHLRISFSFKKICLILEDTLVISSNKFNYLLSLVVIIPCIYYLVSTISTVILSMLAIEPVMHLMYIPICIGHIVRYFTMCSVVVHCFTLALLAAEFSKSLCQRLGLRNIDSLGDDIEDYRLKFEKLAAVIAEIDSVVHFPIAVDILINVFTLCCTFFQVAELGLNFAICTLLLGTAIHIILICLSCGMVKYFVSLN